jgi:hypothetical protein
MNFRLDGSELFIRLDAAADFLSGFNKSDSYLESLNRSLTLYSNLNGMYRVHLENEFFDVHCRGMATIEIPKYQGQFSQYVYDHWERSPCLLRRNEYTLSNGKNIVQNGTLLSPLDNLDHPSNSNYASYSYLNLKALAEFCINVGIEIDEENITKFGKLSIEDTCYFFSYQISDDLIRTDSNIDYLKKSFPLIPSSTIQAALSNVKRSALYECRELENRVETKKNETEEHKQPETTLSNSAWVTMGVLIEILNQNEIYKTKADIKAAIRAKHNKVRGLSDRNLDDILKKASDSILEATKNKS